MEYFVIVFSCLLFAIIATAIGILVNIRSMLQKIFAEISDLEAKIRDLPFPENKILNLSLFAERLKKILQGMQTINPKSR